MGIRFGDLVCVTIVAALQGTVGPTASATTLTETGSFPDTMSVADGSLSTGLLAFTPFDLGQVPSSTPALRSPQTRHSMGSPISLPSPQEA